MKKFTLSILAAVAMAGGGLATYSVLHVPTANAQSNAKAVVDQAIAQGRIGETIGGYLDAVTTLNDAERRAMNTINIGRKSVYTNLAQQQGVSVDVIARLSGEKQIAKAASGSKIMDASGRWNTK